MGYGKKPKSTNKSKRGPSLKARSPRQSNLLGARLWGRTEKIQRRNRKTWTRKFAKEGRQLDKAEVQAGISLTEELPISALKLDEKSVAQREVYRKFYETPWGQP